MKSQQRERIAFIDARTRADIRFVGFSDRVDANIALGLSRCDYAWSEKGATFRTAPNPDFIPAGSRLPKRMVLGRDSPIILMCRSGSHVPPAASMLYDAGYTQHQGFESIKTRSGAGERKSVVNGWKNAGLRWSDELNRDKDIFQFRPRGLGERVRAGCGPIPGFR